MATVIWDYLQTMAGRKKFSCSHKESHPDIEENVLEFVCKKEQLSTLIICDIKNKAKDVVVLNTLKVE